MIKITTKSGTVYYTKKLTTKKYCWFCEDLIDDNGVCMFPVKSIASIECVSSGDVQ